MASAIKRAGITVSGVVQGVGFRFFTLSRARRLGLAGWVRNLPDGRVAVEAEGDSGLVDAFIGELRVGPSAAAVRNVTVDWLPPVGELPPFTLRH